MIWLKATTTTVSLQEIAKILSDRGLQFTSKFMEELSKALEIKKTLSMAYHPQNNKQTERMN